MSTLNDLRQIIRIKFKCLQYIPDEELQIQYKDNRDTFIKLRIGSLFHNGFRCAQPVSGTTKRCWKKVIIRIIALHRSLKTERGDHQLKAMCIFWII